MDSRNLVTSIVTCDMPEAYGRAECPLFTRVRGLFVVAGEVQSKFEYLNCARRFSYLNIDWERLYTLWARNDEDSVMPAIADVDLNPISWSTFGNTYGWFTSPDAYIVWSLHA